MRAATWAMLVAATCLGVGYGALGDGVDAASFVRDGVGARGFGMGGAFVAVAEGHSIGFWSPAALAGCDGIIVGGMYTNRFGLGINFQSLSGSTLVADGLGVELGIVRSSIDDIPFYGDEGEGVFSESQNLIQGCVGYTVLDRALEQSSSRVAISLGGGVKTYTHNLLEGHAFGVGFDLSARVGFSFPWGHLVGAWTSQDTFGTTIRWSGTDHDPQNDVPWINRVGVAAWLFGGKALLSSEVDLAVGRPHLNKVRLGIELVPVPGRGGRAGVSLAQDGSLQVATGGALHWKQFTLDYAYAPHSSLGASHIFSFEVGFETPWREGATRD
jgi:hypothetical protein